MKTVKIIVDGIEQEAVVEVDEEDNIDFFLSDENNGEENISINLEDTLEIPVVGVDENE